MGADLCRVPAAAGRGAEALPTERAGRLRPWPSGTASSTGTWSSRTCSADGRSRGGFDVVLGNPPWERIKLQEKEFFADRMPPSLNARTAAAAAQADQHNCPRRTRPCTLPTPPPCATARPRATSCGIPAAIPLTAGGGHQHLRGLCRAGASDCWPRRGERASWCPLASPLTIPTRNFFANWCDTKAVGEFLRL